MNSTKCFQAKSHQLAKQWYVIDATDAVVGRLAAQIAPILMGKHRPTYTPHIDTGDYVIVTNVEKVAFTGKKWEQVTYARYSGYPGGYREEVAWRLRERKPERILYEAVRRMMPKNALAEKMLAKLKLYVGPDHPHQAQQPIPLEAKSGRPTAAGAIFAPEPAPSEAKTQAKAETAGETEEPESLVASAAPTETEAAEPASTTPTTADAPAPETSDEVQAAPTESAQAARETDETEEPKPDAESADKDQS